MNACVIKPNMPFVAKHDLKRTPATEEYKKMVEFIDSHDFSFSVNTGGELVSIVTPKQSMNIKKYKYEDFEEDMSTFIKESDRGCHQLYKWVDDIVDIRKAG